MQPFEIISAAPDNIPPGNEWSDPLHNQTATEQFDAFIGRALSRSSDSAPDDQESPFESASGRNRMEQNRKADKASLTQPDSGVCAVNSVSQPLLQKTAVSGASDSRSEKAAGVETMEGTGKTANARPDSSAEQLRNLLPSGDTKPQTLQEELQPDLTTEKGGSGSDAGFGSSPAAAGEEVFGANIPGALAGDGNAKSVLADHALDSTGNPTGNASGSVVQPALLNDPGSNGISSAQHQVPMQKADKKNEFSAPAEQNLPAAISRTAGEELPTKAAGATGPLAHSDKSEFSTTGSTVSGSASSTDPVSRPTESLQWPSSAPVRSLERAHDLMSLHAFRLRDSGADSLLVVIKPGTGLQLSLNLQMRNGSVEMRATLHRGDFDFLSRHWSQLQQQLESRGVRLAPLACADPLAGQSGNHFPESDHSSAGKEAAPAGALADFASSNTSKPAATTRAKTFRGWETWA